MASSLAPVPMATKALQNPVQYVHANRCTDVQVDDKAELPAQKQTSELPEYTTPCTAVHQDAYPCQREWMGIEPTYRTIRTTRRF